MSTGIRKYNMVLVKGESILGLKFMRLYILACNRVFSVALIQLLQVWYQSFLVGHRQPICLARRPYLFILMRYTNEPDRVCKT